MNTGIGSGLMEIATGLLGIALIALLVNRSQNVSQLVSSVTQGFNSLLQTVTLQNGMGMNFGTFG